MRKRVQPAARWPCNGAAYPARYRSHTDSIPLSSFLYNRRLSSTHQPSRRSLQAVNHHGGRNNTISCCWTRPLAVLNTGASAKRQFSTPGPLRSDGFDDVDDFGSSTSSTISSMVRRRVDPVKQEEERVRQMKAQQEKFAQLVKKRQGLAARLKKLEQGIAFMLQEKQQYERWSRRLEEVMIRAASFTDIDAQLFEELYPLKCPEAIRIGASLDEIPALVDHYKAELSNCRQALRRINLASRRIKLETRLDHFATFLNSLAEGLSDSVVTPHARAKKNIDSLLDPVIDFQRHYIGLQEGTFKLNHGSLSIEKILDDLSQIGDYWSYEPMRERMAELRKGTSSEGHHCRTELRIARWHTPLGQAQIFRLTRSSTGKRIIEDAIGVEMKSGSHEAGRRLAFYLSQWYNQQWDERSSHNIAWRHLDVVYPFDKLYVATDALLFSVEELCHLLLLINSGYSNSTIKELDQVWIKQARVMMYNLLGGIEELKYLTWLRLCTESRVCSLGDIPDTMSRGLFKPPKPLSSDPRRFFKYYLDTVREDEALAVELQAVIKLLRRARTRSMNGSQTIEQALKNVESTMTTRKTQSEKRSKKSSKQPSISEPATLQTSSTSSLQATNVEKKGSTMKAWKTLRIASKKRSKKQSKKSSKQLSISESAALQTSSTSSPTQATNIEKKGAKKTTLRRRRGRAILVKRILTTDHARKVSGPNIPLKRKAIDTFRTRGRFFNSQRGYSTDSRALLSDQQQCGAAQTDIAWTDNHSTGSLQSMESQNEDTVVTTVSGTQVSEAISSHLSTDESDEPPNPGFESTKPQYWSYNQHKGPDGGNIIVHYCKTLDSAERVAKLFSGSEVIGFDIEWKAQASSTSGIKNNVSLIQIANTERIALFHIAVFRPGNEVHELIPPSLKELLESANTMKVGVCIKADCSRVDRHLGIEIRSQLELSHLYKLVKFSQTQPNMVNRRTVNLSQQVEELLGLPLRKDNDVRRSDWTRPLDYTQVQYAASDAYACICLHRILEAKRKSLTPVPPMPAYAELNMPILLVDETLESKAVKEEEEPPSEPI